MQQNNLLWKVMIDGLIICGFIFLSFPFLKENIIGIQLGQSQLLLADQLPEEVVEEIIQTPTLDEVLTPFPTQVTAYGFVSIEEIEFQQPLLVGLTNQQLLQGGVVMFPERSLQDNFVILGHHLGNQNMLFGLLLQAKVGMQVVVTYLNQQQIYTIEEIKTVHETDLEVIEDQAELLTLITCPTPTRTNERLVVVAKPVPTASSNGEQESIAEGKIQQVENKNQQNKLWQKQKNKSWFFLILLFLAMSGSIWCAHRLLRYSDRP